MVINEHPFSEIYVYEMSPFLSVAFVTSTYDLDFLSHFFPGSWML